MYESVKEQWGQSFYPDILGYFNRIRVQILISERRLQQLWLKIKMSCETFFHFTLIIQYLIVKLIIFPVIPTFCEDHFLLSLVIIGLKQLACIHHSIEGQMSKLVDLNDESITAYLRGVQQSGNKSSQWILVHKDHNSSCQMFSALKCNIVNMPHQFNSCSLEIHIS